jgi:ABC-type glycerol-3-phosphate transport system permease component
MSTSTSPGTVAGMPAPTAGAAASRQAGSRRRRRFRPAVDLPLLVLLAAFVLPIVWLVVLSVQPGRNIVSPDWEFGFTTANIADLLGPGRPFAAQLVNSLLIVAGTIVLCLVVGSATGYALSRLQLARWVTLTLLAVSAVLPLIPPMALVPGLYVTLNNLGLLGSVQGLILLNTVFNLPFSALLMKVYFDGVPGELREAAVVDGASELRVFLQVMVPLARSGLAAVAVFVGIMAWNEFLMGLVMTSGGRTAPLTVGIASLVQPYEVAWGPMAAAGTLATVPIIVLAILANRQIISGLTGGAVK